MDVTQIVLTVIGSLLVPLITLLVWLIKSKYADKKESRKALDDEKARRRKEKKELWELIESQKELLNFGAGICEVAVEPAIKVDPEIREPMKKFLKRYHKLDRTKLEDLR